MVINKVVSIYFSPTGTTRRTVTALATGMGMPWGAIDLTTPQARSVFTRACGKDELVVVGLPVYGGRLPRNTDSFFSGLRGNGAPAVAVVVYGNRAYDDALLELKMKLEECGFDVRAAAALIGEHSLSREVAAGRPDAADLAAAVAFGRQIAAFISGGNPGTLTLKGAYPFAAKGSSLVYRPVTTENCVRCGLCVENCPFGAINAEDCVTIDAGKCQCCFRCVRYCPVEAKQVTDEKFLAWLPGFEAKLNARRCEPELFLPQ